MHDQSLCAGNALDPTLPVMQQFLIKLSLSFSLARSLSLSRARVRALSLALHVSPAQGFVQTSDATGTSHLQGRLSCLILGHESFRTERR